MLRYLLNGRPMERIAYCFIDIVVHKPMYVWRDCYGRYWMALTRWGWFRVASIHGPEIWERKRKRK
jgi:hypothetical protein